MKYRNTIQKQLVIEAVQNLKNHPSADEVYEEVVKKHPHISKGTVYRNLNLLAENGEVLRIALANASDRFDFYSSKHSHFRCTKCGRVYDIQVPLNIDLEKTIMDGFEIRDYELLFSGTCCNCKMS